MIWRSKCLKRKRIRYLNESKESQWLNLIAATAYHIDICDRSVCLSFLSKSLSEYLFCIYFLSENNNDKRTKASMVDQIDRVFIGKRDNIEKPNIKLNINSLKA